MTMESELVEVLARRPFDFESLQAGGVETVEVAREVGTQGFGQAVVLVRVHANTLGQNRRATLRCVSEAPTAEDPNQDFLLDTDAASLDVTEKTAVGTLVSAGLTPDFSYALRFLVQLHNGSGSSSGGGTIELSAQLLLRRGITRPGRHREAFAYDHIGTGKLYVPFRSTTSSLAIGNRQTLIVPVAGSLERVSLYSSAASGPGTTVVALHKNGSTSSTASVTATWATQAVTDFTFAPTAHFDAGDRIHISVDPNNNPAQVSGTAAFRLNTDFVPTS